MDLKSESIRAQVARTDVLGLDLVTVSADRVELRCPVTALHLQANGIVHGGVYCWLVESAASIGAAAWYHEHGHVVGVSNHTNFLRAVRDGVLTAVATPLQRGRTRQLWQVLISNDDDHVAQGELHIANIAATAQLRRTPARPAGSRDATS